MTKKYTNDTGKSVCGAALVASMTGLGMLGLPTTSVAEAAITEAITGGKVSGDFRYRFEMVDQDNPAREKEAGASTLRSRLGYGTGDYQGFGAYLEFEDITVIGEERFDSTVNGLGQYPVVADPETTEVNQAYLSYSGIPDTTAKFGRQRIILDNARFVGNVGWRQNEQTYDAFTLKNTSLPDTTLFYGYVSNVNRIFSDESPVGNTNLEAHLLNASYKGLGFATLTGYAYLLDFVDAPSASNQTLGVRFAGGNDLSEGFKLLYAVEFAQQSDYQDGDSDIDADYSLFELGAKFSGVTAKVGLETLSGDGEPGSGFSTPLATLHAFNGWADQFLGTPADGLEDLYVSIGGKLSGVKLLAVFHDYSSDNGSTDYGSEFGLLAAKKFGKHYTVLAKYASYSADEHNDDIDKLWLSGQLKF